MSKKEKINNIVKSVWSLICAKRRTRTFILIILLIPSFLFISNLVTKLIYSIHTTSIQSNKDIRQSFKILNFIEYQADYKNC